MWKRLRLSQEEEGIRYLIKQPLISTVKANRSGIALVYRHIKLRDKRT